MASKPVFLGNITAVLLTLLAFLQIIPWSLIGMMILAALILSLLFSRQSNSSRTTQTTSRKITTAHPITHPPRSEPARVETIPSQKPSTTKPAPMKLGLGVPPPVNSAVISQGDYEKYEVELKKGNELISEVKATGMVNVYLLDQENLTSLDMSDEFWQEAGEESVQDTTTHFTASSTGKWFLVVENADFKEITATVNNRIA
jgi:cytoskeletal protein RodZ